MKSKKITKKLTLNKKTVSHLSQDHMRQLRGGLMFTDPRACDTNYTCSDFTWAACPERFKTNYNPPCCTEGQLCM